jgi:aspartate 1-decarboxylase
MGSITIDEDLIKKSGLWPGEKVLVVSITTGERLETYVMVGKKGSGTICMNGAAAHLMKKGEIVIIMGFELTNKPIKSKLVMVDKKNRFTRYF